MPTAAPVPRLDAAGLQARIATNPAATPAWQALLRAWHGGDDLIAATLACQPVVAPGLYCARGTATLDRLVAQGRPALLHLQADGRSTWALLQGADARHARLLLGEDVVDVDRLALQRSWDGGYTALWRMPEAVATPSDGAGRGPAVDWLAAHLPGYRDAPRLGPAMTRAVRDFQRDHGLAVDGVVGPETLLALAANEPGPGPTLRTRLD